MRNANDVLRQKEADLARVRREIDSLKIVAALLAEDGPSPESLNLNSNDQDGRLLTGQEERTHAAAEATGTAGLFSSFTHQGPRRWNVLKRH